MNNLSILRNSLFFVLSLNAPVSYAQDPGRELDSSIDTLIKATYGQCFYRGASLDVDDRTENANYRVYQQFGYIYEDPRHLLEHSFIVPIYCIDDNRETQSDSGSIVIIRDERIIWCSKPLIHHIHDASITGFADLNGDGTIEILISVAYDLRGYEEALWILSVDSSGGRLLNEVDEYKQSRIIGSAASFKIFKLDDGRTKIIEAIDQNSAENENRDWFTYAWNGRVFAKQTHSR
jgi:hypothetical protein